MTKLLITAMLALFLLTGVADARGSHGGGHHSSSHRSR